MYFLTGINSYLLYIIPTILLSLYMAFYLFCVKKNQRRYWVFNFIDIAVAIYFIYGIINICFITESRIEPLFFIRWILLALIYVVIRGISNRKKDFVIYAIVLLATIQAIIGILQICAILPSLNADFFITGTFFNPGHLGAFLSVGMALILAILVTQKNNIGKLFRIYFIICGLLIATALFYCGSRGGFLAVLVSSCGLFCLSDFFGKLYSKYKVIIIGVIVVITVGTTILLYFAREKSANSRLLIWNVSLTMYKENPLCGKGIKSFESTYMYKQAEYFRNYPNSKFVLVANNHYQAFNEFIHVACEQGIIGLFILFAILGYALIYGRCTVVKPALLSLITVSSFLYTADIFPVMILFPILLGMAEPTKNYTIKRSYNLFGYILIFSLFIAISFSVFCWNRYAVTSKYLRNFARNRDNENLKNTELVYSLIRSNKDFSLMYVSNIKELADKQYVISKFRDIAPFMTTSDMICDLGIFYTNAQQYALAQMYFQLAADMVPCRVIPNYKLFQLHVFLGNKEMATTIADKILNQQFSVVGSAVLKIRHEIREWKKCNMIDSESF